MKSCHPAVYALSCLMLVFGVMHCAVVLSVNLVGGPQIELIVARLEPEHLSLHTQKNDSSSDSAMFSLWLLFFRALVLSSGSSGTSVTLAQVAVC